MAYTHDELVALATNIRSLKSQVKEINKEIKEAKELFCEEHEVKKKPLNGALKQYDEFLKNQPEWLETVNEEDQLVDCLVGELINK